MRFQAITDCTFFDVFISGEHQTDNTMDRLSSDRIEVVDTLLD